MRTFTFQIGSLPTRHYNFLKELRNEYGCTSRQVVMVALDALRDLGEEKRNKLVEDTMALYPNRSRSGRPR